MNEFDRYTILKIPDDGIEEERLKEVVDKNISENIGPFSGYASLSYGRRKFKDNLKRLVNSRYLLKEGNIIKISESVKKLVELKKSVSFEDIDKILYKYKSKGELLKLRILQVMLEDKNRDVVVSQLEKDGWSKSAIELVISDLAKIGFTPNEYDLETPDKFLPKVKDWISRNKTDILRIMASKAKESELLQIQQYIGPVGIKDIGNIKIREMFFAIIDQLSYKNIEIFDVDLDCIKLSIDQKSCEIKYIEELNNFPYFDTDYEIILCKDFGPYFYSDYCSETNQEKRQVCAIFNLSRGYKISYSNNYLFNLIKQTIENKFYGSKFVFHFDQINNEFSKIFNQKIEIIERERERMLELEKKKVLDQGFIFTEPNLPWQLFMKIPELISKSENYLMISNPYLDNSTFSFLQNVKEYVNVKILITGDSYFSGKIKSKKLTKPGIEKVISKRDVEVKAINDLHSRFIVIDNKFVLFLSPDLQMDALMKKYQYGFWSNDSKIITDCTSYFEGMWNDAEPFDLLKEIEDAD